MKEWVELGDESISYTFEGMSSGLYYFVVTAFDVYGAKSSSSNTVFKEVQ